MRIGTASGFVAFALAVSLSCSACQVESGPPIMHKVKYQVEVNTGMPGERMPADITYTNVSGGISQEMKVRLPWSSEFISQKGAPLHISAQEAVGVDVQIMVSIYVDDKLVKYSASSGAYAVAIASGTL